MHPQCPGVATSKSKWKQCPTAFPGAKAEIPALGKCPYVLSLKYKIATLENCLMLSRSDAGDLPGLSALPGHSSPDNPYNNSYQTFLANTPFLAVLCFVWFAIQQKQNKFGTHTGGHSQTSVVQWNPSAGLNPSGTVRTSLQRNKASPSRHREGGRA